mmetsp:Transcript_18052/g.40039  ORF Transcript_18052/g.40039 Transcript_18052/m.40039 type:complete len:298 (-) Transcript_18052:154-1047(-)
MDLRRTGDVEDFDAAGHATLLLLAQFFRRERVRFTIITTITTTATNTLRKRPELRTIVGVVCAIVQTAPPRNGRLGRQRLGPLGHGGPFGIGGGSALDVVKGNLVAGRIGRIVLVVAKETGVALGCWRWGWGCGRVRFVGGRAGSSSSSGIGIGLGGCRHLGVIRGLILVIFFFVGRGIVVTEQGGIPLRGGRSSSSSWLVLSDVLSLVASSITIFPSRCLRPLASLLYRIIDVHWHRRPVVIVVRTFSAGSLGGCRCFIVFRRRRGIIAEQTGGRRFAHNILEYCSALYTCMYQAL